MRAIATIVAAFALATPAHATTNHSLRAYAGSCIAAIIDVEDPSWNPGAWNSKGSGAFGLGQALPYSKMPRAGWPRRYGGQENPWVQIRWMRRYVLRWGGCWGALTHERTFHWY